MGIGSLDELNDRFTAWVERYLNVRIHSGTGESPAARHAKGTVRHADPEFLRQAFLWSAQRRVGRTATVSFCGNAYQVDAALVGLRVEHGHLVPLVIGRHVHPMAPPPPRPVSVPTGIDHLGQVLTQHEEATTGSIAFRDPRPSEEER